MSWMPWHSMWWRSWRACYGFAWPCHARPVGGEVVADDARRRLLHPLVSVHQHQGCAERLFGGIGIYPTHATNRASARAAAATGFVSALHRPTRRRWRTPKRTPTRTPRTNSSNLGGYFPSAPFRRGAARSSPAALHGRVAAAMAPRSSANEETRDGRRECGGCDRFLAKSRYSKTEWTPSLQSTVPSMTMSRCEAGPDTASLVPRPRLFAQNALVHHSRRRRRPPCVAAVHGLTRRPLLTVCSYCTCTVLPPPPCVLPLSGVRRGKCRY